MRAIAVGIAMAVLAATIVAATPADAQAASSCGPNINAITCENSKPGADPRLWQINGAGDTSIQGFATDISVNAGQKIDFKIDTDASSYKIDIFRTGWYQGLGARHIASVSPSAALPQRQPQCVRDVTTDLLDCGTWGVSASWNVPADAVSGVYIALLERSDTGGVSHIIFVVRNDGNTSQVLFQTSDPTWQAYNTYGGASFYQGSNWGRAYKLSYNRPFATRNWQGGRDFYFSSEYAQVRFMERNGYDVSYMAGVDTDRRGNELLNHKVFLSVGHDEYWSGAQRANVTTARDAGVNLQFLSGNEVYWRTRYEKSIDGSGTDYRTLVTYKETWGNAKIDPAPEWTGTWRDPRFADASTGGHLPENALTGTMYKVNNTDAPITVTSDEGKLRLWRNTPLASLAAGTSAPLAAHTVGYESDEDIDNGFRPNGLIRLSTTTVPTPEYLTDYGNTVVPGVTTHHLTMYRASSGALVFGAGTVQWAWGLDQTHDGAGAPADARMQQAQVNLLADMGAQPSTLMAGLVSASKSTDTTPPTVVITSPTQGQSIAHGTSVTVTGTATDVGGTVAAVEVSTDNGTSWHPAEGTANWSYQYFQQGDGPTPILVRAVDDSANYSQAGTARSVVVTGPASVFGAEQPAIASSGDTSAVELGMKFSSSIDGFVTGVRFFKGAGNTGTHTGSLWDASGARLATVTFTAETATGWQTARFFTAVPVTVGQTYTISYSAPAGGYAYSEIYWPYQAKSTAPLTVSSGVGANAPGVFGSIGQRPTGTFREANYYVDPLFEKIDASPIRVAPQSPIAGSSSAILSAPISAQFSRPVVASTVAFALVSAAGATVAGATTYDSASRTGVFTPTAPLAPSTSYTVTPTATDTSGIGVQAGSGWSFVTQAADSPAGQCPCSLYPDSARPSIPTAGNDMLVTLGVRFSVDVPGKVSAIRFFKGAGNSGPHTGALWAADGRQLATATFINESTFGWQTAVLSTPVDVAPGQVYTASYVAPTGGYSVEPAQYAGAFKRGPLNVPINGGVFTYSTSIPANTTSTSYFVDVVFDRALQPPTLVATSPASGAGAVPADTAITATFDSPVGPVFSGSVSANGASVTGAWSLSADSKTAIFRPSSLLAAGATVVVSLSGVVGTNGTAGAAVTWSFGIAGQTISPTVSLFTGLTPQVLSATTDTSSVELGVAFTSSVRGEVTAVRFYKGVANIGQHVGTLWGPSGQKLAEATFTGESASGWQRAVFSTPVRIDPGVTYTASYLAPRGGYAYTSLALTSPVTQGPLTALAPDNGRFRYGAGGAVPTGTWGSTNYFVDVEFVADPAITAVTPAADATGVATDTTVSATFQSDVASARPAMTLSGPSGPIAGTSTYDASTRVLRFTPASVLSTLTLHTAKVALGSTEILSWSFRTTQPAGTQPPQTFFGVEAPPNPTVADATSVEVGTAFQVAQAADVTAIRFFKEAANTGVHVGTLWSASGQALAQVTFVNESGSGWQRADLSTPVRLQAGTRYVVSVFMPQGKYSVAGGYFSSQKVQGIVTLPGGSNGVYKYGSSGGFPDASWNSTAYFVDAEVIPK